MSKSNIYANGNILDKYTTLHQYSVFICWNKIDLLFLMKYMQTIQVRKSTVKTLSFQTDHLDKSANWDQPAPYESVCLGSGQLPFRLHIVVEPQ